MKVHVFVVTVALALVATVALIAQDTVGSQGLAKAAVPMLTEVQGLKLQNFQLQMQAAQAQMALLQSAMRQVATDREALLVSIEQEHPGWTINRDTGQWAKKTEPPAAPKK